MIMKYIVTPFLLTLLSVSVVADLEPYKDYELSESVWSISTIKVDPNMGDAYLEGIKKTWVASNEVGKKLGQIKDYSIFRSELPQSGDFNLLLVVEFENTSDLAPNKKKYEEFMKEWGNAKQDETREISQKNYPGMRTISGEYLMREVTIK